MYQTLVKKTLVFLCCLCLALGALTPFAMKFASAEETTVTVSPSVQYQEIDGWGSSLIWWAGQVGGYDWEGDDGRQVREQIMDLVYGEDGLDFNIARYNVGGGEDPNCAYNGGPNSHLQLGRNMEGFKATADSAYDWSKDEAQRWVLDWIQANRDDEITEFFSNAPPWWMTRSGCVSGADNGLSNLKEGYEDEFALYFVDVLEHMIKVDGMTFDYVNPFNESTSTWWKSGGSQEGCYFTNAERDAILKEVIRLVDERGLDVEVTADDSTGADKAIKAYNALSQEVKDQVTKLNYHLYENGSMSDGDVNTRAKVRRIANTDSIEKVWMSEMGYNMEDHLTGTMATAFTHSARIRSTLNSGMVNSYVLWQIIEELSSQLGSESNYGPIKVSFIDKNAQLGASGLQKGSIEIDKQYYILGQYSKYIKQGYRIIQTSDQNTVGAVSPDGTEIVLVRENNTSAPVDMKYSFDGYVLNGGEVIYTDKTNDWTSAPLAASGDSFHYTVSPSSVTTFVLSATQMNASQHFVDESAYTVEADVTAQPMKVDRLYYSTGWNETTTPSAMLRATRYIKGDATTPPSATIKFNGTGIRFMGLRKSDAATINVYIDGELVLENVDLKQPKESYGEIAAVKGLESGEHVAKLEVVADWINLDGAYILTGTDTVYDLPVLTDAAVSADAMTATFTGAGTDYVLEYRATDAKEWTTLAVTDEGTPLTDGKAYTVTAQGAFSADQTYYVRIKSGANYSQTKTVSVANVGSLAYYVNCGASSTSYSVYESAGINNRTKDRVFGEDLVTGKQWGRTSVGNATYQNGVAGSLYQPFGDVVSGDGNADGAIEYKFELAAGDYNVVLGIQNPWSDRACDITVNGVAYNTFDVIKNDNTLIFLKNVTPDADGFLTVRMVKNGTDDAPLLGTIMIAQAEQKQAFFATLGELTEIVEGQYRLTTERVEQVYGEVPALKDVKANIIYTDGTTEKVAPTLAPLVVENTAANTVMGALIGTAAGLPVQGELFMKSATAEYYYRVDCGSDGSNSLVPGTAQGSNVDQQSTDANVWGYMDASSANWASDPYDNSIRNVNTKQLRYRLTGLPAGQTVEFEVGSCAVWGWGSRSFNVYVSASESYSALSTDSADWAGLIKLTSDGHKVSVKKRVTVPANGTLYVIAYNTANSQHPQLSYINVMGGSFAAVPSAPTADKTEVSATDTVKLGGLITGANVIVTDQNKRMIDIFEATAETHTLNLGDYDLTDVNFLSVTQRIGDAEADSAAIGISLPQVTVSAYYGTDWTDSFRVVRFMPSAGVSLSKLSVTSPSGVVTSVIDNEYFHYRALESGVYTVSFTTRSNKTYTQTFDVSRVDTLTVSSEASTKDWTDQDVVVTLTPSTTEAIKEFYIDDEAQQVQASYTLTATENRTYNVKIVTYANRTLVYDVVVDNIDKAAAPKLTTTPDTTFTSGLKLDVETDALSGATLTLKQGEATLAVGQSVSVHENGSYTLVSTTGAGKSQTKLLNFSYDNKDLKMMTVGVTDKDGKVSMTVAGANGGYDTVSVTQIGGDKLNADGGAYAIAKSGKYLVYAVKGDSIEAYVVDIVVADGASVEDTEGCKSSVGGVSAMAAMLMLAAAVVLGVRTVSKRGKRGN